MRRIGLLADLAAVLLFVGIGRSVHDHGLSIAGMASTAWPFLAGLAVAWTALALWWHAPTPLVAGVIVCAVTVAVGMTLRLVSGQGIAFAFVLVALAFLGALMIGWRILVAGCSRLRSTGRAG
ncbi:MAG: DUF3054 domain-containing protein [Acidimicrobiales bacterium]